MSKRHFVLGLMLSGSAMAAQRKDIVVNFDVNKTILLADLASGKDYDHVMRGMLAENIPELWRDWDGKGTRSYYAYLSEILKGDKKRRSEAIAGFPDLAAEMPGNLQPSTIEMCKPYRETMEANEPNPERYGGLLKSFLHFLGAFDQFCSDQAETYRCHMLIRTFGKDGAQVTAAIDDYLRDQGRSAGIIVDGRITDDGMLTIDGINYPLTEMWTTIKEHTSRYIFVQDNYPRWAKGGRTASSGKPFPLPSDDTDAVTTFFDDNAEGADAADGSDIVQPFTVEVQGGAPGVVTQLPSHLMASSMLVAANPYLALTEDNYFIELFRKVLPEFPAH